MNFHQLKNYILQVAGRMTAFSFLSRNDSQEGLVYVDGAVPNLEQGEPTSQEPVRKLQWFGFRSRPPVGSEALIIAVGGSSICKVLAACDSLDYGPMDLEEGEVAVFSKSGSVIKLDKNGNVTILPGPGAQIRLGSDQAASLDAVALSGQLKTEFDAFVQKFNGHTHSVSGAANLMTGAVTGTTAPTANSASSLSKAIFSSNVQAKK